MNKQLRTIDLSMFHFNSYGIVAADNPDNEKEIKVFPSEKLYLEDGDQNVKKGELDKDEPYKPVDLKLKYKNLKIIPDDIEPREILKEEILPLDKTKYLYADWCGINSPNRMTPPNVCKGEKVILYRYGNSDAYYWDTLGYELNLRKEDHVVHAFSDKPSIDEGNVKAGINEDLEDTYYTMISPKNKTIKLHTTDKYGEYTTYDITLKTDDGYLEIVDGKKNVIRLDSTKDSISMHMEGTSVQYDLEVNGDDQNVNLTDSKGNHLTLDSKIDDMTINTNKTINLIAGESLNIDAPTINTKSTAINNAIGTVNYTGGTIKHDGVSIDKIHVHTGDLGFDTSVPNN